MNITCKVSQRDHDIAGYRKVSPEVWMHEPCSACRHLMQVFGSRNTVSGVRICHCPAGQPDTHAPPPPECTSMPSHWASDAGTDVAWEFHVEPHLYRPSTPIPAPTCPALRAHGRPRPHSPAPVSRMRDCLHSPAVVPLTPPYPPHPIQSTL